MAPSDKPGANSRGRGGKWRKYTRGGGKNFSRDLQPVDADGNPVSIWQMDQQKKADANSDDSEEDSEEDSDDSDAPAAKGEPSRVDRKQDKKARKDAAIKKKAGQSVQVGDLPSSSEEDSDEEDDDMPANPNHSKAARNMTRAPDPDAAVDEAAAGVDKLAVGNRKERESLEAAQAKERYRKLHEQGKTDEAKADIARLKLIREQRESEGARRQAEKEEREAQEKQRKTEIDQKEAKKREAALGPKKAGKKAK